MNSSRLRCPGRLGRLVRLALLGSAMAGAAAHAAPETPLLDPDRLVQLAVARNADLAYTRLQSRIAEEGFQGETGLYQPVLYGNSRIEGRRVQRTVEQQLAALLGQVPVLDERVRAAEAGVKGRTPTGAELSFSLRTSQKINNILASTPSAGGDREAVGAVVLTVRQPLLRGAGRDVVETDLQVADAERRIAGWQLRQQLARVGGDALTLFWQLQRARASQAVREQALGNAREVLQDVQARINGGRLPPAAESEALATIANREADLARGVQALADGESRLRTLLDLPPDDAGWRLLAPEPDAAARDEPPRVVLDDALQVWPAWRMAELKREQAVLRLRFAEDRKRPGLDVVASYSTNGLARGSTDAVPNALHGRYPDWYAGVSFEIPFGGEDPRASAQYRAQRIKLEQSDLELTSVRQALANELAGRDAQWAAARQELDRTAAESSARDDTLEAEREQFRAGVIALNRLLRREGESLEAKLRWIDSRVRLELARIALQTAQGTLLSAHDVRFED